jgi:hypothetical protein
MFDVCHKRYPNCLLCMERHKNMDLIHKSVAVTDQEQPKTGAYK